VEPGEAVGQDEQAASWVEVQGVKVSKTEQDVMAVQAVQAVLPGPAKAPAAHSAQADWPVRFV